MVGLFSLPQKVSPIDIQASFEKAYWRIEPFLEDSEEELASSTLRSIALNYIHRTSPNPPKALVNALNHLKKRDDIVITKPDKGVVVMDRTEYIRLLSAASVDNLLNLYTLMKCDQNVVDVHLSISTRSYRKR